jgi:RHS repeat-associated protein
MSSKSNTIDQIISLPQGGGALHGIGEKFSADLFTGTGNFTVPIALPPGRNGFQPQLNLVYSTGNGNGPFGLGWQLSIPGIMRKTSKGIPQYRDNSIHIKDWDTFILSGTEDLVPVALWKYKDETADPKKLEKIDNPTEQDFDKAPVIEFRPRTEGLFAHIYHHRHNGNDYWEVRTKDGLTSFYGTPKAAGTDPAVIADPDSTKRRKVFAWKLTQTKDPFGNLIEYEYERDWKEDGPHHWDQLYLSEIRYVDYDDDDDHPSNNRKFLVHVKFSYEDDKERPDKFSEYRAGFEIRTVKRCHKIEVSIHTDAGDIIPTRTYHFVYLDELSLVDPPHRLPHNGVSLLSQIMVEGHDGSKSERLPPLEFDYTKFEPEKKRDFFPITGPDMPPASLANPDYELVDLMGNGLPDILEMNGTVRYWRNLGNQKFDWPREMQDVPAGIRLADPGVQLIDANGDGRADLLVTFANGLSGYYPTRFGGVWDHRSFQRYDAAPSFNLKDPEVRLVDLTGDGITDVIRSGSRLECYFNDPVKGWHATRWVERRHALSDFPNVNFSDARVRSADMTGDGMQDIVLVYDGNIEYWPSFGYGNWGKRISMRKSPHYPYGYDPKRILIGDVDGDGLADIVYVDDRRVTLWINQSGNSWSDPIVIVIKGTPQVSDTDAIRLADMLGSGMSGLLWSTNANAFMRNNMFFLDFVAGIKPYLLNEMDNHIGAATRVQYVPSTKFYLEDQKRRETRWKTLLPFPVHVVSRVEVIDEISHGKLTTEYHYHHGYWDGIEREFRGFGRVDQLDTETFKDYHDTGLHPEDSRFDAVSLQHFSQPTATRTWFHQGAIEEDKEYGGWQETHFSNEFWSEDQQILQSSQQSMMISLSNLRGAKRHIKRDALRTLRGHIIRTELYALDETSRQDRPYTVTEYLYDVMPIPIDKPWTDTDNTYAEESSDLEHQLEKSRTQIFFPITLAERITRWERGSDPMIQFSFTGKYDIYGQVRSQISIAVPRGQDLNDVSSPSDPYLVTHTETKYAIKDDGQRYIANKAASTLSYEIKDNGNMSLFDLKQAVENGTIAYSLKSIISHTLNFYDGSAFQGLSYGEIGNYGALVRTESLAFTNEILNKAYRSNGGSIEPPPYLTPGNPSWTSDYPQEFRDMLPINEPLTDVTRPNLSITRIGYGYSDGGTEYEQGYYVATERIRYDFHGGLVAGKGLVNTKRDPLGHDTIIIYDNYHCLPIKVTDAANLAIKVKYDYRVLQPYEVTDLNGNRKYFVFSPSGFLESIAVMGKNGENVGDTIDKPSTRYEYHLNALLEDDFYLFNWSEVPGNDSIRLKKFLERNFIIDENNETVQVTRTNAKTLNIAAGNDSFLIELDNEGTKAFLKYTSTGNEKLIYEFVLKEENSKLKVYSQIQPIFVRTVARVHHAYDTNVPFSKMHETIDKIEYSDGFGRLIQIRSQAEDVIFDHPSFGNAGLPTKQSNPDLGKAIGLQRKATDLQNVVVSGWQIYDNKGRIVEKYEPFFSQGWSYASQEDDQRDKKVSMYYNPRGQVVRTVNPDNSEQQVVYGVPYTLDNPEDFSPTPWEIYTYDANDNAGRTHKMTSALYQNHHNTPSSIILDAFGRKRKSIERNSQNYTDWYVNTFIYDIKGNLLKVIDTLNRQVFNYVYDLLHKARVLRVEQLDAGIQRIILDPAGNIIERRDSKESLTLYAIDTLNRPVEIWARDRAGESITLREVLVYGDDKKSGLTRGQAATLNLLGNVYKHYDEAGLLAFIHDSGFSGSKPYDFIGNVLEKVRYVIKDKAILEVFTSPPYLEDCQVKAFRVNWQGADIAILANSTNQLLDKTHVYRTSFTYDALNRVKTVQYPEAVDGTRKKLKPEYNRAGALESITLDDSTYVAYIAYNANGQRILIAYGNNVMTRYAYDQTTFRLLRMRSEKYLMPNELTYNPSSGSKSFQEFSYDYDLVGNIIAIHDRTPRSGVSGVGLGINGLDRLFTYDPLYHLLTATGRECKYLFSRLPPPWSDLKHCDDAMSTRIYEEHYSYDKVGNMKQLKHLAGVQGFTRDFEHSSNQNRLATLTIGTIQSYSYDYDFSGNLITEGSSRHFEWDHSNRMRTSCTKPENAEPSVYVHYLYDSLGQRVKKVVRKQGGQHVEVIVYINGLFEYQRAKSGTSVVEKNTIHIMDNQKGIATVRIPYQLPNDNTPAIKYQLADHLSSSNVVIDDAGTWIRQEEYTPYGETSFGSFAKKRYRFSLKERDKESGLYYYGTRYYMPWCGRWITADPLRLDFRKRVESEPNTYSYVNNNPLKFIDPTGEAAVIIVVVVAVVLILTVLYLNTKAVEKTGIQESNLKIEKALSEGTPEEYLKAREEQAKAGEHLAALGPVIKETSQLAELIGVNPTSESPFRQNDFPISSPLKSPPGTSRTGTVWDYITPTTNTRLAGKYAGSQIPRYFELTASGGQRFWVDANVTEHIAEFTRMKAQNYNTEAVRLATQIHLESLHAAVSKAAEQGIEYGKMIRIGDWELRFMPPKSVNELPQLVHGLYKQ